MFFETKYNDIPVNGEGFLLIKFDVIVFKAIFFLNATESVTSTMRSTLISSVVFIAFVSRTISATKVKNCKTSSAVSVVAEMDNCDTPPCVMKRGSKWLARVIFTPDQDYEKLHIGLFAEIAGIKKGFPGVDRKEVCDYLYTNPGKVKAGCPLKAGVEYVYENSLNIDKSFLTISLSSHWTLKDKKTNKDVWCFDLPIKIE